MNEQLKQINTKNLVISQGSETRQDIPQEPLKNRIVKYAKKVLYPTTLTLVTILVVNPLTTQADGMPIPTRLQTEQTTIGKNFNLPFNIEPDSERTSATLAKLAYKPIRCSDEHVPKSNILPTIEQGKRLWENITKLSWDDPKIQDYLNGKERIDDKEGAQLNGICLKTDKVEKINGISMVNEGYRPTDFTQITFTALNNLDGNLPPITFKADVNNEKNMNLDQTIGDVNRYNITFDVRGDKDHPYLYIYKAKKVPPTLAINNKTNLEKKVEQKDTSYNIIKPIPLDVYNAIVTASKKPK